ncbi:hypothetical protein [Bradyrhizobium sp. Arg816]|uniref:hypothetical protein n=1 Tax=Bradyrhizobium sp. Arg816 TaxID=2998491 RepID=UPI00249DE3A1|nr:hypothetical protein [Bradyrhizobium sp. Arg816]MDI3564940.1 hypothetical protein [Bradyrhizobium sp. Arg816]
MAQIGIFRTSDAAKAMGDNLQSLVARGLLDPKNADEWAAALNNSAKAMEDVADQAKVAGAALPQFQQAMNDTNNARKQLDGLATEAMSVNRGFFTTFSQQIHQGASAWDAFKSSGLDALGKISDKLMSMAADKLFASAFGGSAGGLASLFGLGGGGTMSFGGDLGAGTGGMAFPKFANGGTLAGGWGVVGERGPELINVHKGGVTVIPNNVSKPFLPGFADGGNLDSNGGVRRLPLSQGADTVSAPVSINIDARGADAEGLARVEGQLRQLKAELPGRIVSTVEDARKKRVLR